MRQPGELRLQQALPPPEAPPRSWHAACGRLRALTGSILGVVRGPARRIVTDDLQYIRPPNTKQNPHFAAPVNRQ